jgi:hypothetical protein
MKCKEEDLGTASSRHERKEKHTQSMFGNLQERTRLEEADVDGTIMLKWL